MRNMRAPPPLLPNVVPPPPPPPPPPLEGLNMSFHESLLLSFSVALPAAGAADDGAGAAAAGAKLLSEPLSEAVYVLS